MLKLITPLLICFSLLTSQVFGQVVLTENFDTGIPATWTVNDLGAATGDSWAGTTGGFGGSYLDGTEFAFVNSDANGNGTLMIEELVSPTFDGTPYTSTGLFVSFDHFYRSVAGDQGLVLLKNTAGGWDTLDVFVADDGAFGGPANKVYDITSSIHAAMQLRFVYDDGDQWAWYWAIDNFNVYVPLSNDMSAVGVKATSACGSSDSYVDVTVLNSGYIAQSNIPVNVDISGAFTANATATIPGPVAPGASMTVSVGPFNSAAGGMVMVDAYSALTTDQNTANDTLVSSAIFAAEASPMPAASAACPGSDAYAIAMPVAGTTNQWFDAANTLVGTGDSLALGMITADTTVYLSTSSVSQETGGLADQIGGGQYSFFGDGLIFDVTTPITLDSVFVYGIDAGDVTVNLLDASGAVLNTTTAPLLDITGAKSVIPVGFAIAPGTGYQLSASGSTITSLNRENGDAVYPYSSNGVTITGPINALAGYYYFFYDWAYTAGCESGQVAVTVTVSDLAATANVTNEQAGSDGSIALMPIGGTAPYTYLWDNGETTATIMNLVAGNYCGTVTDADGCTAALCEMVMPPSATQTIEGLQSINLYPNPTQNRTTLEVVFENAQDIEMEVSNVLGQTLIQENYGQVTTIQEEINLEKYPAGNYFMILKSGNQVLTKRIVLSK